MNRVPVSLTVFAVSVAVAAVFFTGLDAGAKGGKDAKSAAPRPPADSAAVAAGARIYAEKCALCHGPGGRGDGPGSVALNPKPRNLTDPKQYKTKTDEEVFAVIQKGGSAAKLSPVMPAWGTLLKKDQIWQVVAYIRTLPASEKTKAKAD